MKKVCKVLCWILGIFIGFILVNLIIGTIKYGGTKSYSEILNKKDWQQSVSKISLLKPNTRVIMFYEDSKVDIEEGYENSQFNEVDTEGVSDVDKVLEEFLSGEYDDTTNHNPYDPDYEDEFNSFFGGPSEESFEIIPIEDIEDLEPAGFVVDEKTGD